MDLLENVLAPSNPSQVALSCWDATSSPSDGPTIHAPFHSNREVPSFCLGSSLPLAFQAQLSPEGTEHFQRMGFNYYDPFAHAARQQATPFPWLLSSYLPAYNSGPTPTVSGCTINHLLDAPSGSPPASVQDLLANGPAECTEDILQFLRMRPDHRYECLWDDGSGGLCGHSGTLLGVKRHLRSNHDLKRYILGYWGTSVLSAFANIFPQVVLLPILQEVLPQRIFLEAAHESAVSTSERNRAGRLYSCASTGENPFECQDCEMAFKSPNARRGHRIRQHGHIPKKRQETNWRKRQSHALGRRQSRVGPPEM